ncbi:hypothetical protein AALP_AA2G082100 [Arabis alpina]|uniref:Uncharacterized protein n=1 Tax=Arabis alpina TaxID=50452 RepID=A0A087HG22_ARAAL|nr:hypothetical protein AALP_AA2G082100 [Arabis alpina]
MTKTFESLSTSFTSERNVSLDVDHETPLVNSDLSAFLTEIEAPSSRFEPIYANTSEQAAVNLEPSAPFVGTSDRTGGGSGEQISPSLSDERSLDSMDIWNNEYWAAEMRGATPGIHAFTIPSIPIRSRKSRRLSGVSNRSDAEEKTPVVKDGSQKIPFATNVTVMQMDDDASGRGSVPDELNEPKGPGDTSRSKGKGKVDPVDKKAEKKRISAKAKADLEAGRILTFRIGGTCEVLPSEAPVAQSLGVIPPASLLVNSHSTTIPLCPAVQTTFNVSQTPLPRAPSLTPLPRLASELSSKSSLSKRRRTTKVSRQGASSPLGNSSIWVPFRHGNRWSFSHTDDELPLVSSDIKVGAELIRKIGGIEVKFPANLEDLLVPDHFLDWSRDLLNIINSGSRIVRAYEAVVSEKEEQIKFLLACTDVDATRKEQDRQKARADSWERLEDEVKKRDVHLEAASTEIARLRANLEKSRFTEDRLRKERDEARRRTDEIASDSSALGARHSSRLERIRSYLIALHAQEEVKAQLYYTRASRMSLEKMVEAVYELPHGLLENHAKEEKEYLAKVKSFDSLGDDTLFPTPPRPSVGLPRDVASQVPEGISEHRSFLSPQDNQDCDQV